MNFRRIFCGGKGFMLRSRDLTTRNEWKNFFNKWLLKRAYLVEIYPKKVIFRLDFWLSGNTPKNDCLDAVKKFCLNFSYGRRKKKLRTQEDLKKKFAKKFSSIFFFIFGISSFWQNFQVFQAKRPVWCFFPQGTS